MTKDTQSYTEKMKELQEKLKKRSQEIFRDGPDFDEPQATGNPHKALEEDEDMTDNK
jgi:hypothetical protein